MMNHAQLHRQMMLTVIFLLAALCLFETTNIDLAIQDRLYLQSSRQWLLDAHDPLWRFFLYDGIKGVLILLGGCLFIAYLASFRFAAVRPCRSRCLLLFLSLALVPLIIAGLKGYTNVYCPYQLQRYGGDKPYVKVFAAYPPGFTPTGKGRCFPAGHAAGGFSLMALYFVARRGGARRLGLFTGLAAGWIMGFYQMAKGAHFLSHTVVTMLAAWLIILVIRRFLGGEDDAGQAALSSA